MWVDSLKPDLESFPNSSQNLKWETQTVTVPWYGSMDEGGGQRSYVLGVGGARGVVFI